MPLAHCWNVVLVMQFHNPSSGHGVYGVLSLESVDSGSDAGDEGSETGAEGSGAGDEGSETGDAGPEAGA